MRPPRLGHAALFTALLALCTSLRGFDECPRSLDCARAGRDFCRPGSSHCGPCLRPLVENSRGRCVVKRRHPAHPPHPSEGEVSSYPELDQEIDFLSAIISEQRTKSKLPASEEPVQAGSTQGAPPTEQSSTNQSVPNASTAPPTTAASTSPAPAQLSDPLILPYPSDDHVFITMSGVFVVAGSLALMVAGACWLRLQRAGGVPQKVEHPAYGLMRAHTFSNMPGDKKLAHSAQMYHYQHQKQQMLSMEKHRDEPKVPDSGASTDEENEDGDFTVYECPGLAPTGEMEVKNPLFDDSTLYLHRFHQ